LTSIPAMRASFQDHGMAVSSSIIVSLHYAVDERSLEIRTHNDVTLSACASASVHNALICNTANGREPMRFVRCVGVAYVARGARATWRSAVSATAGDHSRRPI